jgi:hypothetical protein
MTIPSRVARRLLAPFVGLVAICAMSCHAYRAPHAAPDGAALDALLELDAGTLDTEGIDSASPPADAHEVGDGAPEGADGEADAAMSDTLGADASDDGLRPIPHGGWTGGPVDGRLTIFVIDDGSGAPIEGAVLRVVTHSGVLTATTGAQGRIDLTDGSLRGRVIAHAFARGHGYLGLELGGYVATLSLTAFTLPDPALIQGTIRGWDVLSATTATTARYACVEAITNPFDGFATEPYGRARADGIFNTNVAVHAAPPVWYDDYSYEEYAINGVGIVVLGGTFAFAWSGFPATYSSFTPVPIDLHAGDHLAGIDVEMARSSTTSLTVTASTGSLALTYSGAFLMMPDACSGFVLHNSTDNGSCGSVMEQSPSAVFSTAAPRLEGPFRGARYSGYAQYGYYPYNFALVQKQSTQPDIELGAPIPIPQGISASGRRLWAAFQPGGGFWTLSLLGDPRVSVWQVIVTSTNSVTFPDVPPGFIDPIVGTATVGVAFVGVEDDFDRQNLRFGCQWAASTGQAASSAVVRVGP